VAECVALSEALLLFVLVEQAAADWSGNVEATLMESFDRSVTVDVMHCTQPCKICEVSCTTGPTVAKTIEHPNLKLDRFRTLHTSQINSTCTQICIQLQLNVYLTRTRLTACNHTRKTADAQIEGLGISALGR
jgi:hypothetical protein